MTCHTDAWAAVKPFREADKAKVRYLLDDEITRLVNACPPDFRAMVTGALMTGCRYGELSAMKAGDFDPQAGTVTIRQSKGGKPRHVALTDEGRGFFQGHGGRQGRQRSAFRTRQGCEAGHAGGARQDNAGGMEQVGSIQADQRGVRRCEYHADHLFPRIASPEMLPSVGLLPHVICCPPGFGGGEHEADQHGDTG